MYQILVFLNGTSKLFFNKCFIEVASYFIFVGNHSCLVLLIHLCTSYNIMDHDSTSDKCSSVWQKYHSIKLPVSCAWSNTTTRPHKLELLFAKYASLWCMNCYVSVERKRKSLGEHRDTGPAVGTSGIYHNCQTHHAQHCVYNHIIIYGCTYSQLACFIVTYDPKPQYVSWQTKEICHVLNPSWKGCTNIIIMPSTHTSGLLNGTPKNNGIYTLSGQVLI